MCRIGHRGCSRQICVILVVHRLQWFLGAQSIAPRILCRALHAQAALLAHKPSAQARRAAAAALAHAPLQRALLRDPRALYARLGVLATTQAPAGVYPPLCGPACRNLT